MKSSWIGAVTLFAVLMGLPCGTRGQSSQALPIPSVDAATDFAGEHEMPDPNLVYKIAFDIAKASSKIEEVNPGLVAIARFFNTLAKGGVPADHRMFVVVFHQQGTPLVLNNAAYKARNDGHDNPNIALIHSMKTAGIDFRVCGQGVLAQKIDAATILPDVQVDQWALTTLTNLQLRGYARVAGL
jgi:intracellular sulfur oxidation DsrE/DsrF family protein